MNKRNAFTLVELIVAMSIFTMLLSGVYCTLGTNLKFTESLLNKCEKQQISISVLWRILRDVRSAEEILVTADEETLVLKIQDDTIEYSLTNTKVRRKKNGYSRYLTIEGDIAALSFTYPEVNLVGINLDEWSCKASLRN